MAWLDDDGAYMCADSALTTAGAARDPFSSFGEAQQVTGRAVEEGAFKMLRLGPDVVVGLAGDADRATGFCQILVDDSQLARDRGTLRDVLRQLLPAFVDHHDERAFDLAFAHRVAARPALTVFSTRSGLICRDNPDPRSTFMIGSLPHHLRDLVGRAGTALRRASLRGEVVHVAMLGFLQALGVSTHMPQHGIGGAYFGASITEHGLRWQPDVVHALYVLGRSARPRSSVRKSR